MARAARDELTGIIGATSFVGASVLTKLESSNLPTIALTRKPPTYNRDTGKSGNVQWVSFDSIVGSSQLSPDIPNWITLAPIWAVPAYFDLFLKHGAKRIVALSSTSAITKLGSSDIEEQALVKRLLDAEVQLRNWAESNKIEWTVLRSTMIYGHGRDQNLSEIARIIRKTGFFPLLGSAQGLRQPVHVDDVASACLSALQNGAGQNNIYVVSGAEVISYREMVSRIFRAMGKKPLLLTCPDWLFRLSVGILKRFPRYRSWKPSMVERMNLDMAFPHDAAARDFGYSPRPFQLKRTDLP